MSETPKRVVHVKRYSVPPYVPIGGALCTTCWTSALFKVDSVQEWFNEEGIQYAVLEPRIYCAHCKKFLKEDEVA